MAIFQQIKMAYKTVSHGTVSMLERGFALF
ncbi:hypothetical protein TSAR_011907 [Trichomalopsis sarcophagae]|uniref:Uncharacterized protein n=1 Tax=Trichomalopsis sarcophagae TaxID=543379 RepID=A0A232EEF4_9HYME|nr:hypothetical protein TSAR_011907 [Trichomalopsis sarcophagae]